MRLCLFQIPLLSKHTSFITLSTSLCHFWSDRSFILITGLVSCFQYITMQEFILYHMSSIICLCPYILLINASLWTSLNLCLFEESLIFHNHFFSYQFSLDPSNLSLKLLTNNLCWAVHTSSGKYLAFPSIDLSLFPVRTESIWFLCPPYIDEWWNDFQVSWSLSCKPSKSFAFFMLIFYCVCFHYCPIYSIFSAASHHWPHKKWTIFNSVKL